jgi:hypothetical protein
MSSNNFVYYEIILLCVPLSLLGNGPSVRLRVPPSPILFSFLCDTWRKRKVDSSSQNLLFQNQGITFSQGVRLSPPGTAVNIWPIVPDTDDNDDDCGAIGGMKN